MDTISKILGLKKNKSKVSESAKYYGLVNQGATCYLNSVLQVLFMTKDFIERVKSHTSHNPETEHIDRELSDLFIQLEENTSVTSNITNRLKINNVHEQRDAAELYEKILRLTSPGASQIFHGELTNRNKCQKCATVTERAAGFWLLPLPLMDTENEYSVESGIEDFFHPSVLSGDDQMYCEACDDKCDAVLDSAVKHHPEVLVLHIKRFEFDFCQRTYLKISCVVDVPYILNVQNQTYELYGIVEHLNEHIYGRYIATIRSQYDGRWHTFDDTNVTLSRHQYFQMGPREKSRTVYLLFYQRRTASAYNGLLNLGATCYLNSVLQVLFMTEGFKESVTRYTRNNPGTEHIDRELRDLFSELETRCAYTFNIIKKLKISNVEEQRDAAEHYEKILRLTSHEASKIFHGKLQNSSTCLKCRRRTESSTGFWHLPLSLLDSHESYSVFRSIKDFFHREVQMYCEKCEEECIAVMKCDMKLQPDVLVILLKRFEYDDQQMRNIKNNREVDVPYTLCMPQTYELYACVEHFGELRFGHYIARIRSQDDGRWYIFDDMNISLNPNIYQEHPLEGSQTAYLLFYLKIKEEAMLAQNTEDNITEEEDSQRRDDILSEKIKTNGDVIHVKQPEVERDQENTQEDQKEMKEDGQELHHSDDPNCEKIHDLDVDELTDSLHKLTISDHQDSVNNRVMETQSDAILRTSLRFSESFMKADEIQQENKAHYYKLLSNGSTDDAFNHRFHGLVENTYNKAHFEPGEMPPDIKEYRLKNTIKQNDLGSLGEEAMSGESLHGQERTESEGSAEKAAVPQPYKIHYPDCEDFIRVQATKVFIRNEEQMKNQEDSGCTSLPSEVNNAQLNIEGSQGTISKRERSRRARLDRVEHLGVTKEGDAEIHRFKPKKRQDSEQNTISRTTGDSHNPEATRHLTHV